jgi:hypothetical protein
MAATLASSLLAKRGKELAGCVCGKRTVEERVRWRKGAGEEEQAMA